VYLDMAVRTELTFGLKSYVDEGSVEILNSLRLFGVVWFS